MTPGERTARCALAGLSVLAAVACAQDAPAPDPALPMAGSMQEGSGSGNDREALLGPFLSAYWRLPVEAQGEAPEDWSAAESSLDPAVCGACHPKQLAEWKTSLHAGAFSPGFAGQLVEGSLAKPRSLRSCQKCHTPLEEQLPVRADGTPSPVFDAPLRERGIVCASCHVRSHRRFGPPRRAELPAPAGAVAHGGFEAREEFGQARFCATCHQFFDREGPAGKPVENTFVEWRESFHAAEGRTCQSCHMPDRSHTWRGIHDPDTVRGAVEVTLEAEALGADALRATLAVANRGVGHAFPSYVTPRVFAAVWQADAAGREIEGTRREATIGREIDFASRPAREVFDTRVLPGEAFHLGYVEARAEGAASLRGRVRVDPAHHYRGVYRRLLRRYESPEALARIEEALARADRAPYVLAERSLPLPGEGPDRAAASAR